MSKINVLDSKIYNRISAGEVVERPASVIKELVENAIDAQATTITIEIEKGGTKLIKISDNGIGIEYDDLKKAFLPHATSKISCIDDLDSIATLGFRGEALASIASVSQVELISKTKDATVGGKIVLSGGAIEEQTECGSNNGTSIKVSNLFFNTPARLKFLKSDKQEEGAITNIVNRLILANPNVSFKYIVDGKVFYNSFLKGLKEKIFDIYGKQTSQNIIYIEKKLENLKLCGYISLPSFCKPNKTYQTIVVNNRYVSNNLISVAVSNAYENFLMKGKFPLFVLHLEMNFDDIDVNVHPNKLEVKFKDTKSIYNLFYSTILESLNENNCPLNLDSPKADDVFSFEPIKNTLENKDEKPLPEIKGGFSFSDLKNFSSEASNINVSIPIYKNEINDDFSTLASDNNDYLVLNKENEQKDFEKKDDDFRFDTKYYSKDKIESGQIRFDESLSYKIVGTIFNTYIIIESEDNLFLIDQHAGHERVLFDKLMKQFEEKKMINQPLLVPFVFNVNEIERELVENNISIFKNFGFEIEEFGPYSYKIGSIPALLVGLNLQEFIDDMLKNTTKISSTNEQIKNHFATCACKAAVKGGQKLNEDEIDILLREITKSNRILLCPHGRPICVKISKYEVEKTFKRIV